MGVSSLLVWIQDTPKMTVCQPLFGRFYEMFGIGASDPLGLLAILLIQTPRNHRSLAERTRQVTLRSLTAFL